MPKAILLFLAALVLFSATAAAQTNYSATYISGDQIASTAKELQAVTKGLSFRNVDVGDATSRLPHNTASNCNRAGWLGRSCTTSSAANACSCQTNSVMTIRVTEGDPS